MQCTTQFSHNLTTNVAKTRVVDCPQNVVPLPTTDRLGSIANSICRSVTTGLSCPRVFSASRGARTSLSITSVNSRPWHGQHEGTQTSSRRPIFRPPRSPAIKAICRTRTQRTCTMKHTLSFPVLGLLLLLAGSVSAYQALRASAVNDSAHVRAIPGGSGALAISN